MNLLLILKSIIYQFLVSMATDLSKRKYTDLSIIKRTCDYTSYTSRLNKLLNSLYKHTYTHTHMQTSLKVL